MGVAHLADARVARRLVVEQAPFLQAAVAVLVGQRHHILEAKTRGGLRCHRRATVFLAGVPGRLRLQAWCGLSRAPHPQTSMAHATVKTIL